MMTVNKRITLAYFLTSCFLAQTQGFVTPNRLGCSVPCHDGCLLRSTHVPEADHGTRTKRFSSSSAENINGAAAGGDTGKGDWDGNVVSNADGQIRGCKIQQVEGSMVDWELTIDGVEADLGRFSQAIYKKILGDAKQQRFQGFKPGTIPPQLEPTYRAFAMDECARETVLEALQQNNIRPFESCRQDMVFESFSIPSVPTKPPKKKKKKKRAYVADEVENTGSTEPEEPEAPKEEWRTFESMKEAISAGWRPGQSFSFVAKNVKGQQIREDVATQPGLPPSIGNMMKL